MRLQDFFKVVLKKRRTAYDKCYSSMSYTTDQESSTLPQNSRRITLQNVVTGEDAIDGAGFSLGLTSLTDSSSGSSQRRFPGLVSDGCALSRLVIDEPDSVSFDESVPSLFLAIQIGDTHGIADILRTDPDAVNKTKYYGFHAIHHACNVKNMDSLKELLLYGAKVGAYDSFGNTPLHLAVAEGWHEGIHELLSHGASPDIKNEPPKSVKEMRSETPLHAAVRKGDLISTNLLVEYKPDLRTCDSEDSSILHLAAQSRNLDIVSKLVKVKACQNLVTNINRHGLSVLHEALNKECDSDKEKEIKEIIRLLIHAGADVNAINHQGETPIFLAARWRISKVVEFLLAAGADPTGITRDGQTLIHAACSSGCASSLSHLINTGLLNDRITRADSKGREPFHFAVKSSSIDCCELLLKNGDHLTRKDVDEISRFSLILNRLPSGTQLLHRLFDDHVRLSNKPHHDPDFNITFDYSILLSPDDDDFQSSLISELTASPLEPLIKHPLLESFLYFKWQRIKNFFYIGVFVYFLYLLLHTIFIILTFGHFEINWAEQVGNLWIFITLHLLLIMLILIPDLIILLANFKKYMQHLETYSKIIALASSAFVLFSCTVPVNIYLSNGFYYFPNNKSRSIVFPDERGEFDFSSFQNTTNNIAKVSVVRYAAAISSFFGWIEFMMLLGRFPSLGSYVLMFTRVAKSIIKFMLAFSSLLIGFALSFMVLFYESPIFKNFPLSLMKTLMMMIGEIEYGDLYGELQTPAVTLIFLVLFLFLVCIVMANLLIGLAVSDIPDLQRQGKIRRLAKQAAYLISYEKLISVARNLKCFPSTLRILMASRSKIIKQESVYPNKDCNVRKYKYKKCLPDETVQEAILLGNCDETKEEYDNMEDDLNFQFKSFRIRYNRDRKLLHKKLANLSDNTTNDKVLTERLNNMQMTMERQLDQIFFILQNQWMESPQNQNSLTRIES